MTDPSPHFRHFREVPAQLWRWPNFSPAEIACRGTGQLILHHGALDRLQALRDRLGKPMIVRSGFRSPEHNRAIGGAPRSKHLLGTAFDIAMTNHDPAAFEAAARAVGFLGFGFYPRAGFMHIDLGPARTWGERLPPRAVPFAPETPAGGASPVRSRTLAGSGAAGALMLGAVGLEISETLHPPQPVAAPPRDWCCPWLGLVLMLLALGGIAVAAWARLDDRKKGLR